MTKRVAMISVHECPLASKEGKDRGGINVYTHELGKALSHIGWHVDIFTRIQDDINERVVSVNDRFRVIHLPNGPHTPLSKSAILEHITEFSDAMRSFIQTNDIQYDVLHAHYYLSGLVAHTVKTMRQPTTPVVMTFHTLGLLKQLVSRGGHSEDPKERIDMERTLAQSSDRIITSSESGKIYLSSFYDTPSDRIAIIPPGVDTSLFRPIPQQEATARIGIDKRKHMILAVGRIDPVKGFDVLLAAIKLLLKHHPEMTTDLCLCIVGGDISQTAKDWSRELTKLNALRSALNLTMTVQFVPPKPQKELPYYYSAADLVVMPSHYESFGMVALEALACNTPVIATDVTGISHILKEFPHGHIVSANNPIALAHEIEHVLLTPHHRMTPPATLQELDWKNIAKRMADEYASL